jgi:hypothetical protein
MIREEYHNHVFELFRNSEESLSLNAGDKIPVSREELIGFIENAYDEINSANRKKSLDCGFFQNKWSGSMVRHYKSAI